MSTVDDPQFLLRHLRTCFITSDESGLCELLVEPDLIRDNKRHRSGSKLSRYNQQYGLIAITICLCRVCSWRLPYLTYIAETLIWWKKFENATFN